MSLNGTYTGLQASVADFLNRTDLTATIPDFIALAEATLNRELRTRLMTANVTLTVTSQFAPLPSDFAGVIAMQNSNGQPLDLYEPDAMAELTWENSDLNSTPTAYSVVGGNFQFYPIPSPSQSVTLTYYQRLPALATAGSNWLLTNHPDAYLFGALTATAPYLKDDDRVEVWGALFKAAIDSIMGADRERYGARLTPQPSFTQII